MNAAQGEGVAAFVPPARFGDGGASMSVPASADAVPPPRAEGWSPIRLLVFTTLYPNVEQPRHGVFVEERLRKLVATGRVTAHVVAPVPWFPFRQRRFGAYAKYARVPRCEERYGIRVEHPRYAVLPKVGMNIAAALLYRALLPAVRRLERDEGFDVLDAHYFYPDGVAAARLGAALGKPVVVTARGNDLTLLPHYRSPRRQLQWASARVTAITTVSRALKDAAVALGMDGDKITVLRNGVDLQRFGPRERNTIRTALRLAGPIWLTVGHLIERKGVRFAVTALAGAPEATLLVAGDGPEGDALRSLAGRLGVAGRVRFLGAVPHDDLCRYYNAADVLMHPSSREGMPNVVLEALACGTPVVAAPFAGVDEVIGAPEAGEIASERSADAILAAWRRLHARAPERTATRRFAERLGWDAVVDRQCALYAQIAAAGTHAGARSGRAA